MPGSTPQPLLREGNGEIHVTGGGTVSLSLAASARTLGQPVTIALTSEPPAPYPIRAGWKPEEGRIFLAPPATMPAGRYLVSLEVETQSRLYQAQVALVVDPLPTVPQNGPPPAVLLNGFDTAAVVLGGDCTLEEDSTSTFGRLEEFLESDGVAVYFFDNCRFGTPPIETIGNELGTFLAMLTHPDGSPVEQVDLIGFSMGTLIIRAYLAGKQAEAGVFEPPSQHRVRKAVLVAGPLFGSPLANLANVGEQLPQLRPGSRFSWDLATWHQEKDDLRGVDALAIAGSGARDGRGDGVVPLTSASLASDAFFGYAPERTRVIPACHNAPARLLCSTADVMMDIESEEHPTFRIVRSFLAGGVEWQAIGQSPSQVDALATRGGVYFALMDADGPLVTDIQSVVASPQDGSADTNLSGGAAGIFSASSLVAGDYIFRVTRPSGISEFTATVPTAGTATLPVKLGPHMIRVQPAAGAVPVLSVAPDSLISIFGRDLVAGEPGIAVSLPLPAELAGAAVTNGEEPLGLLYAGPNQVNGYLPPVETGLVLLAVENPQGRHTLRVLIEPAVPALFALDGSGQGPAAALDAVTGELLTPGNPVAAGRFVALFGTGLGATAQVDGLDQAIVQPVVTVGGAPARLLFAGKAPRFVGLNQINIELLAGTPRGAAVPVVIRSGTRESNVVTLAIE